MIAKSLLHILFIIIFLPTLLSSQQINTVSIFGTVKDSATSQPLAGVLVEAINEEDTTERISGLTDRDGKYILNLVTSIKALQDEGRLPSEFRLLQNYPNPFNPSTIIQFEVPRSADVQLIIYNTLGQKIRTLVSQQLGRDSYTVEWDGTSDAGAGVAAGIYFYQLRTSDYLETRKMILLDGALGGRSGLSSAPLHKKSEFHKPGGLQVTIHANSPQIKPFKRAQVTISSPSYQFDLAVKRLPRVLNRKLINISEPGTNSKVYVSGLAGAVIADFNGELTVTVANRRIDTEVSVPVNPDGSIPLLKLSAITGDRLTMTLLRDEQPLGAPEDFIVPESIPPVVLDSKPTNGDKHIIIDAIIYVYFSEPIETSTVNSNSFYLTDSLGYQVQGTIGFLEENTVAYLVPIQPLAYSTQYTITVNTAVTDLQGLHLEKAYLATFTTTPLNTQPPDTLWTRTYGVTYESGYDEGKSVLQTPDGGYIILANTESYGAGFSDIWLIRTNNAGDTIWTKTYGGTSFERGNSFQQTSDSGFIITGSTSPNYLGTTKDIWLIKISSSGDILWTQTYGGLQEDDGNDVKQTSDGGYIIVGTTSSFGAGGSDVWLIKTDASGDTLWTRTFGGFEGDEGRAVEITSNGNYLIVGNTRSYGAGDRDIWLIKVNSSGSTLWTRTYGSSELEFGEDVLETTDSCYAILGHKRVNAPTGNPYDIWLIISDTSGDTLWTKTYSKAMIDHAYALQQTSDAGYIIAGSTTSGGGFLLIKTDVSGDTLWTKTFHHGSMAFGSGRPVQETTDGGYIIATITSSDVCLIKTDSSGDSIWTQTYGGLGRSGWDSGNHVEQTSDGGYIIVGHKSTYGNFTCGIWLIKTNEFGDTLWTKTFGGDTNWDEGKAVRETLDGGYIIVGTRDTAWVFEGGDIWVIKTDAMGDSLWSRAYSGIEQGEGKDVQETSIGDFVILGNIGGDVWLIKTNSMGDTIWTKSYSGGSANALEKTSDGGYAITGKFGGQVWLVKTDSNGDTLWTQTCGLGSGMSLQQTFDGGYIITGGAGDSLLLIKTDVFGNTVWTTTYCPGPFYTAATRGNSVKQTIDGGYIITGTYYYGGGDLDMLLIRTDATGNILWIATFGSFFLMGNSVQITSDGGCIITGQSIPQDIFLMKTAPDLK